MIIMRISSHFGISLYKLREETGPQSPRHRVGGQTEQKLPHH